MLLLAALVVYFGTELRGLVGKKLLESGEIY